MSSSPSILRRFKSSNPATSSQSSFDPFIDPVVHGGSSENLLYLIDPDDDITKVRSDPKGFVNVSRVAGQQTFRNRRSVETKVSLAWRLYLAMVIRSRRTNSWAIPLSQAIARSTPPIVRIA
ncbi:hypothetical protein EDB84DRAFT_1442750 [Lactarius hengduanensis]|nr:hypothetical protein EDB84DRAFT_1442750 [Lactarius hengduanensis]